MFKFNIQLLKKDMKEKLPIASLIVLFIVVSNIVLGKVCYSRVLTGIPCAGCGITRAFQLVFQLKLKEATMMHPFWIAVVILFIWFFIGRYFVADEKISKKTIYILKICGTIIVILCFAYYIYRMIVWYPNREPLVYDSDNILNMLRKIFNKQ